jgi:hypothetical protein
MLTFKKVRDHYEVCHENGVFCGYLEMKEDGLYDWWPEQRSGYLPAWFLREVADKLDEINAPYEKEMRDYFDH